MEFMDRNSLASRIYDKIQEHKTVLSKQFEETKNGIGYFFIDELLPEDIVLKMYAVFPKPEQMVLKKSLREDKYIAAQMNLYDPILEDIIYAFQQDKIVRLIGEICGIEETIPDEYLYNGGISMMGYKQFLNPHLDNSHDKDRNRWRVLNLLYYITPDWNIEYGGNLELWPDGLKKEPITIHSKYNRLVVMATHNNSLHSVSPVTYDGFRCCVSNYYFSKNPLKNTDTFHVTSFRGRPEQNLTDVVLKVDTALRMLLRKIFKNGVKENPHVYKK
ncbi:2OG-Fe(II) oxygenase [Flavobacterium sp. UMI-01]|uniref:2OG-Fe(II) oxygenase n=1 Tax=Flavobacterium sp. UMI-01 TaxID=1441053 RepID=UPI002083FA61|nr:2OG-Fe(II) oxygenase [Flavobacterium sp. UMI-01]GIZ10488.1 hypothetical protein FUMI01_32120 [Flavobacterium sp. UMI-01]